MKTAVVILNYNGKHFLEQFMKSVILHSAATDAEIYVADNASTDNSVEFIRVNYPQIKLILLDKNYGFAGGYNEALKEVVAEYFVLLNSDVEVTANWLAPVISYLDIHPETVAAQPKILAYHDKNRFEHAGAAGGYLDKYGYPFCRGRIFNETEIDNGQYNSVREIFWASGACLFIRSKDFWDAGGFDSQFFAHMEEIDLCWRLKSRGKSIVCIPESKIYHVGGGTLTVENPQKTYLNFRNNLLMLYKNLPSKVLFRTIFIRLILDGLAAIQFLMKGKTANVKSIWQAHMDFYKLRSSFSLKRKENLSKQCVDKISGFHNENIVAEHYLLGKKYFSELEVL